MHVLQAYVDTFICTQPHPNHCTPNIPIYTTHYMPTFKLPYNSHSSCGGRWKIIWHVLSGWHFLIGTSYQALNRSVEIPTCDGNGVNKQSREWRVRHGPCSMALIWCYPQRLLPVSLQKGLRTRLHYARIQCCYLMRCTQEWSRQVPHHGSHCTYGLWFQQVSAGFSRFQHT